MQNDRNYYRLIVLIPGGAILGAILALFISAFGGMVLGLIEGIGYVIQWDESIHRLYETANVGLLLGIAFGTFDALPCGGFVGACVAVQGTLFGIKNVTKPRSITVYVLLSLLILGATPWIIASANLLNSQSSRQSVINSFGNALVENDSSKAKSLSSPEQWEKIEDWVASREGFECPFSWRFDNGQYGEVSDSSFVYGCFEKDEHFTLNVADIKVEQVDGEWQVADWGQICEVWERKNINACTQ